MKKTSPRRKKAGRIALGVFAVLLLAFWGAWNVDMARQTLQIAWLDWTGGLWKLRGRVEKTQIDSAALKETRSILVYLPPGYDAPENKARRYPVIYLLHGFPDPKGDGWARFGLAPQMVDKSIVDKEIPPLIVVMPNAHADLGKFGDGEYLNAPVAAVTAARQTEGLRRASSARAASSAPGTQMETYLARDMPVWTDKTYRTIPQASARLLGGISTGGYGAVNVGLKHPDIFGTLISISGYYRADLKEFGRPLWPANPTREQLARESPLDYLTGPQTKWKNTFVWFSEGGSDYADAKAEAQEMVAALEKSRVAYRHYHAAGHHSWDAWRAMLLQSLRDVRERIPGERLQSETMKSDAGTIRDGAKP